MHLDMKNEIKKSVWFVYGLNIAASSKGVLD